MRYTVHNKLIIIFPVPNIQFLQLIQVLLYNIII